MFSSVRGSGDYAFTWARESILQKRREDMAKRKPRREPKLYLESPTEDVVDPVAWWGVSPGSLMNTLEDSHNRFQLKSASSPVLAMMAKDYLAIFGASTVSEASFSKAGLTDTSRRNAIGPEVFGKLQLLKSAYRNGHISAVDGAQAAVPREWSV